MDNTTTTMTANEPVNTQAQAVKSADIDFAKLQAEAETKASEVAERKANAVFADYLKQNGITDEALKGLVSEWQSKRSTPEKMLSDKQTELEKVQKEFTDYKKSVEIQNKVDLVEKHLASENLKPNLTHLVAREFDVDKIEIENNAIKSWNDLVKPIKEKYKDYFGTVMVEGAAPAARPTTTANIDPMLAAFDRALKK